MAEGDATDRAAGPGGTSPAEIELRRYEARLGVWKVVLGTFIVGLAGVLIPGAINYATLLFDNSRKQAEFRLAQETAHQQYIKDFFEVALNQDIELRIRFADYFAHLSGDEQLRLWTGYRDSLVEKRDTIREAINELERQLAIEKLRPESDADPVTFDRINRELAWAYSEIGYAPLDRSVVTRASSERERLYRETASLVQALADQSEPISENAPATIRFWTLYQRDLIGVESRPVAAKMIEIGRVLRDLAADNAPPDGALKRLAEELGEQIKNELSGAALPPAVSARQTRD